MARDALQQVAHELVTHPQLGDSKRLRERSAAFGDLALTMLARQSTGAAELRTRLDAADHDLRIRVLLDAVVRDAISTGTHCDVTFSAAAKRLSSGELWSQHAPAVRAPSTCAHVWSGAEGVLETHFKALFETHIADRLARGRLALRSATDGELAALERASALLREHVPAVFDSVLAHVDIVAVADGDAPDMAESCSWVRFPSTVFVTPMAFGSTYQTAEVLLHEATHHKHYDMRRCRSILSNGYRGATAAHVTAFWNAAPANRWPTDRAISAGHVYVHVAYLYAVLGEHPRAAQAIERARHLLAHGREDGADDLGEDGVALVAWLLTQLDRIEAAV